MISQEELGQARAERWRALAEQAETPAQLARAAGLASAADIERWRPEGMREAEAEMLTGALVELALWPEGLRYATAEQLELVYVLAGDRHPAKDTQKQAERGRLSRLAAEIYELMRERASAVDASDLIAPLGGQRTSMLSVERALAELARGLKVLRVGRSGGRSLWRTTTSVHRGLAKKIDTVGAVEAAAGLVTLRLGRQVCETEAGLSEYFAPVISQARVHAALRGLAAGKVIAAEAIEGRPGWRLSA